MRILDIDLDFFLSDVAYWCSGDGRLEHQDIVPWPKEIVRSFLENQCGLDKNFPLPGKFVEEHNEVFYDWRDKIESGEISKPFEVVHVDAHADLGMGDASYEYIMTKHLGRPVVEREHPHIGSWSGIGPGNYLVFAISCRWISRLTYVHHPKHRNDILDCHMKNHDLESESIQLKYYGPTSVETLLKGDKPPISLEPEVPFKMIPGNQFKDDQSFDRIYLAQSPTYTPESADRLIPIIKEYMTDEC